MSVAWAWSMLSKYFEYQFLHVAKGVRIIEVGLYLDLCTCDITLVVQNTVLYSFYHIHNNITTSDILSG